MNKDKFLTVKWNNILTITLGIPTILYGIIKIQNNDIGFGAFLVLFIIGAVYWIVVEQHSGMRFAYLREKLGKDKKIENSTLSLVIMIVYNVIWWAPIILAFTKVIDYKTGFIFFLGLTVFRALANIFRNNILKGDTAEKFPFRQP